jgi:probable F420-dependent oxidoreductase
MEFGITIKPDITIDRIVSLTRQAESAGFTYGWIFDSHVIWMEPFPLLTLMAANTKKMRLGPCVTNPAVRDVTVASSLFATLNVASHGRMVMGIGRGDSSRRVLGKKTHYPGKSRRLRQYLPRAQCRPLHRSRRRQHKISVGQRRYPSGLVAGYGPKALRTAGRIGDGVILQFADPDLISWCLGFVREGAREAGRDFNSIEVMAAAPVWASDDLKTARDRVRWFPALVSNHVLDLISKYKPEELPRSLTSFVQNRGKYDYHHHCEVGSDNADFVSDEVIDRFCLVGPIEQHCKKLEALRNVGVTQFNIYLMCGDEEKTLDVYGREVLPLYANLSA